MSGMAKLPVASPNPVMCLTAFGFAPKRWRSVPQMKQKPCYADNSISAGLQRRSSAAILGAWSPQARNGPRLCRRPAITGERVTAWCMSSVLLMENAEPTYRSAFLKSLGMQGRYLGKTAASERAPMDRMRAAMGAVYAGLCLPDQRPLLTDGLKVFVKAAAAASLADGGSASRSPSHLLERVARLIQVRSDLEAAGEAAVAVMAAWRCFMAGMKREVSGSTVSLPIATRLRQRGAMRLSSVI